MTEVPYELELVDEEMKLLIAALSDGGIITFFDSSVRIEMEEVDSSTFNIKELKDRMAKLHAEFTAKFDNSSGEDAPYYSGYLKAIEDIGELME